MSQLPYHVILVARLHRQPCLLVDRKEHVVVEDDGERDLARIIHVIKVGLRRRRDLDDNALPVLERKLRVDCVTVCMGPVNKPKSRDVNWPQYRRLARPNQSIHASAPSSSK